jgi:hypothetical protein
MNPIHHVRALLSTWRGRFILVFASVQLLLPLHYYVGHRDPHDERFAWRMFSPVRLARCTPDFALDRKAVDLEAEFEGEWVEMAKLGRFTVVEAMAQRLCAEHPGSKVTVSLQCAAVDGSTSSWGGHDMCAAPRL